MTRNKEGRVFAIVLGSLLLCELTLLKLEPALSGDVRHIQTLPEISDQLAQDATPLKVLWLGNSITDDGVDVPLADSIFEQGMRVETAMYAVHPDGSAIAEWTHIANNTFFERGVAPDVLVIPFAWNLLSDQSAIEAERIGRWYLHDPADWLEFLAHDAVTFENGARALLSNVSAAFGNRERVRTRVLASLPGYEFMASRLSRGGRAAPKTPAPVAEVEATYSRLERLIAGAKVSGTQVVLVAMPVREPYVVDEELIKRARALGVAFVDARDAKGIGPDSFRDEMHLLPAGARIVTEQISRQMVAMDLLPAGQDGSLASTAVARD